MLPSNLFPAFHDSIAAKNRRPVSRTAVWHEGQFRPLRLLFSLAAVFATGLALFLAAGGAVVTAALFAGAARGEHGRGGGEDGEGEEGERQFHKIWMCLEFAMPAG